MRRFLFRLHSCLGLFAGMGLIVIGVTGSVLVFRQEIEGLMMPKRVHAAERSNGRLDLDTLVARLREQLAGYEPVGWRPSRAQTTKCMSLGTTAGNPRCSGSIPAREQSVATPWTQARP